MFEASDKRQLYWLIDEYLTGRINASKFCEAFYLTYDLEVDMKSLFESEHSAFRDLSKVAGRFSQFEADLIKYPRIYYSEVELRKKILAIKEVLSSIWPNINLP